MIGASERIVVIGGGIAGLASAALLARDGHRVTLLEAHDTLGGRADTVLIDRASACLRATGPIYLPLEFCGAHVPNVTGSSIMTVSGR